VVTPERVKAILRQAIISIVLVGLAALAQAGTTSRKPLEPFVLNQYQGGLVDLPSYRGKVVLINFWASWCLPCVAEFPSLMALKDSFVNEPFEVLAINMGEDDSAITSFVGRLDRKLNFPILLDRPVITVANSWSVRGLPTTIIADKTGNMVVKVLGDKNWNSTESRAALQVLLEE